jgi:chromosomal replication initiator protein
MIIDYDIEIIKGISFDDILKVISENSKHSISEILSKSRKRELVYLRHLLFYFTKKYTGCSLSKIARHYGKNHTTVRNGIISIMDVAEFKVLRQKYEDIFLPKWFYNI